jgi:hypothetical protein
MRTADDDDVGCVGVCSEITSFDDLVTPVGDAAGAVVAPEAAVVLAFVIALVPTPPPLPPVGKKESDVPTPRVSAALAAIIDNGATETAADAVVGGLDLLITTPAVGAGAGAAVCSLAIIAVAADFNIEPAGTAILDRFSECVFLCAENGRARVGCRRTCAIPSGPRMVDDDDDDDDEAAAAPVDEIADAGSVAFEDGGDLKSVNPPPLPLPPPATGRRALTAIDLHTNSRIQL